MRACALRSDALAAVAVYTLSSAPDTKTKQGALANLEAFKRKHAETIAKNRALMEQWERQVRDSITKQGEEARSKYAAAVVRSCAPHVRLTVC